MPAATGKRVRLEHILMEATILFVAVADADPAGGHVDALRR